MVKLTDKRAKRSETMLDAGVPPGLMFRCSDAVKVEMDILRHKAKETPGDMHLLCRGGIINGGERLDRCACKCHNDRLWKCLECGTDDAVMNELGVCSNRAACNMRVRQIIDDYKASKPWYDEAILTGMGAERKSTLALAGLGPILLCPSQCEHCGLDVDDDGVTAFLPGHINKLKRELTATIDTVESIVELSLRGWLDGYRANKVPEDLRVRAEKLLAELDDPVQWSLDRCVERW